MLNNNSSKKTKNSSQIMLILLKHKPKYKVKVNSTALRNRLIMRQEIEERVSDTQKQQRRIIIRASQAIKWEEP